jgi:hypothetical protein
MEKYARYCLLIKQRDNDSLVTVKGVSGWTLETMRIMEIRYNAEYGDDYYSEIVQTSNEQVQVWQEKPPHAVA